MAQLNAFLDLHFSLDLTTDLFEWEDAWKETKPNTYERNFIYKERKYFISFTSSKTIMILSLIKQ